MWQWRLARQVCNPWGSSRIGRSGGGSARKGCLQARDTGFWGLGPSTDGCAHPAMEGSF